MSPTTTEDSTSSNHGYAKTSLNTVNRYRGRGQYEYQHVYPIIDEAPILHVAFHGSPDQDDFAFPVILPMLGCTGNFEEDPNNDGRRSIYLHGYVSSRIMRLSRKNPASNNIAGAEGIPVCVSATLMDGIVLALTPNHHSCNYRSAVAFGYAQVVEDEPERLYAMELITNNLVPERWQHTRYPNKTELKSTGILRIDIHSASAKVRAGTTGEAREDLKDETMRTKVWAGVVPSRMVYGTPLPAPTNMFPGMPEYIEDWVEEWNEKAERYSAEAAGL
ncbi:flavin-nucleotide-binding protein [Macroventuria anomochaeta]|uniref:Flavin-nucleotide-binding protein n=1 Tax=Macroventuria anomochaeta TaxID=301207 RepID=A0ACB6RQ12_9PLEO|nr:flavin-nucleotide-binding protein [Macroventuria anomochaeta]KAF2623213.1 flavin-nucleotide-binding protein [Macroventuria anomochaeta]